MAFLFSLLILAQPLSPGIIDVGSSCGVSQESLDQVTLESGGYEITADEFCDL